MFQELLKKLAVRLQAGEIPYMIIGGQAVLLYGEPRLTKDIDVTLGLGIDGLSIIRKLIDDLSLTILVKEVDDFVQSTMVLPARDEQSGIRVDFIFSFSDYERQAIRRARVIHLDNIPVCFAELEDLVIHKIIAGRARDFEDVRTVLLKNPDYDQDYIYHWLNEFDHSLGKSFLRDFKKLERSLRQGPEE